MMSRLQKTRGKGLVITKTWRRIRKDTGLIKRNKRVWSTKRIIGI